MCESKIKAIFNNLVVNDKKKNIDNVKEFVETYQREENLADSIIKYLLKGIGSLLKDNQKVYLSCLRGILHDINKVSLSPILLQMKQFLFLNKVKDLSKGEFSILKLGSILSFDALIESIEVSDIDETILKEFYQYVLAQINEHTVGFVSTVTLINFFKKMSSKQFEMYIQEIKKDIFKIENLEIHPQYLLLWLSFTTEQKKILAKCSKNVPSIQSKDVLSKLTCLLKNCKKEQSKIIFNYLATDSNFTVIWQYLHDLIITKESNTKMKQIILCLSFEVVCPQEGGLISKLPNDTRVKLLNKIWSDQSILNLLLKQLSDTKLDLHKICVEFVLTIDNMKDHVIVEQFFQSIKKFGCHLIENELKIKQTARLSNALLRNVQSVKIYRNYVDKVIEYLQTTNKTHEKIYAFEQLSTAYCKCPTKDNSLIEILMKMNYENNHNETNDCNEVAQIEAARLALIRCLDKVVDNDNFNELQSLMSVCKTMYASNQLMSNVCQPIIDYWTNDNIVKEVKKNNKKRSVSQRNETIIDLTDATNQMFISLMCHLCFYMTTQPFDEETMDMITDVQMCFDKYRGVIQVDETSTKKAKIANSDDVKNKDWKIVLSDVLIVLLEQNCHYLRTLALTAFKKLVLVGLVDSSIIANINGAIDNAEVQSKNVDKKENGEENKGEQMDIEEEEEESDVSDDEDSIDEDSEKIEESQEDELKSRIFAALGSMTTCDVNSDSDDNCPEVAEESESSDNEDNEVSKPKVTLKEKRHTMLQLKQFRNRCIELLETVFLNAPKICIRLEALSTLLERIKRSDIEVEKRLLISINKFKKHYQTDNNNNQVTTAEIIEYINQLLAVFVKCTLSKNVIQIFSTMVIIFIRMRKQDIANISLSFKPIIDQCIFDKKKHPMKAIFMATFDAFPEISFAFNNHLVQYLDNINQSEQVRFQVIGILRKMIANSCMKTIVSQVDQTCDNNNTLITKTDILAFVQQFTAILARHVLDTDIDKHPKYSTLIVGCLVDCLKLGGKSIYENMDSAVHSKIKETLKKTSQKEVKKAMNQFIAAADNARKTVL